MENIKSFFDSFKEFIWDIIGYLLPGSYLLIILSVVIRQNYSLSISLLKYDDLYFYIFVVISYLLGYLIYGLGRLKEGFFRAFSYQKQIEKRCAIFKTFKVSKELLELEINKKGLVNNINDASYREIRNIVMSYIPESDQKIYTFTFRSEFSSHIGNVSIIIGTLGLFSLLNLSWMDFFLTDRIHIVLYICLVLSYFLFRQTRNRFYEVSISLPFSIYLAKLLKDETKK
jgi:hypothetical protein